MNDIAQSQETFALRSAKNEHFAELVQRSAKNEHFAELGRCGTYPHYLGAN